MTVYELIEKLKNLDPELRVTYDDRIDGSQSPNVVKVLDLGKASGGKAVHLSYDWREVK